MALTPKHPSAIRDITSVTRRTRNLEHRSCGPLHIWGDPDDPMAPTFINGWDQRGDPYQPLSWFLHLGGGPEILGSPTGGTLGSSCGVLPAIAVAHLTGKIPAHFVDDSGVPIGGWIQPDGNVVVGV